MLKLYGTMEHIFQDQDHLDLCLTAIDEQFDPGNKTAVIRGEEHHRFGDVVRIAQPPQRDGGRA